MCKIIDIKIKLWYINNRVNSGGDIVKFRSMILVLTIAFSAIFMTMIGSSYAYYVATDGTTIDVTTSQMDTGVAVIFQQSQYINVNTGIPIESSAVDTLASKSVFTITPDAEVLSGAEVMLNISIIDIAMSPELRVSDFKYKLTYSDGTSTNSISGDGTDFTDDVISSGYLNLVSLDTTNGSFSADKTYTCTLYVWIEESGADQSIMMNKKFRGLIKVNTLFKK